MTTAARTTSTILGVIGVFLYALTGVLYLSSGLVVPEPWYLLMWVIWLVGIYPLYRVFQRGRPWTPLVAFAAAALWFLIVSLGEALLGWTA